MKNSKIPIIVEKNYQKSIWCAKTLEGIGKQKYEIVTIEDTENFEENSVVPIIGTTNHFLKKSITACIEKKLRPIVVGTEIADIDSRISTIKTSRKGAISGLLKYSMSSGRNNVALLGINKHSNMDMEKKEAFLESCKVLFEKDASNDIYYTKTNANACINELIKNISSYNSVICSNDYFAVAFVTHALQAGLKIPDDIFVSGYGNSFISENIIPSITTVTPKYSEMGAQARKAYYYLSENPNISSMTILVDYDIIVRESTANMCFERNYSMDTNSFEPCTHTIFDDAKVMKIIGIDRVFASGDASLIQILKGILNDESYSNLAEKLYLSDSAFRYKLNKIFSYTHTQSKSELKELLDSLNLKN